jgi:putative nucleotidyltransferase with HDIG domain
VAGVSTPARFLQSFAQAIGTVLLYQPGHPARERTIDRTYTAMRRLLETTPRLNFTFLPDEVVFGTEPVRELGDWPWSQRFGAAGIQRLEFDPDVSREDLEDFLDEMAARLTLVAINSAELRQMRSSRIRFGAVGLQFMEDTTIEVPEQRPDGSPAIDFTLSEEADAVRWLHEQVQRREELRISEAEALVRSLTVSMHGDRQLLLPLLRLREYDEYTTTHALNVAMLAMAFTEFLGLSPKDVRAFGVAGLLHDIGKVHVPRDILMKPGPLTHEERRIINLHPVDGARIIFETQEQLELAAVVAYEHHIMIDGGGYPVLRYRRDCHYASRIIHVCDVYDALRTRRPYRDAWEAWRVLSFIEERAGTEFDATMAPAFVRMMQQWEARVARVSESGEVLGSEGIARAGAQAAPV